MRAKQPSLEQQAGMNSMNLQDDRPTAIAIIEHAPRPIHSIAKPTFQVPLLQSLHLWLAVRFGHGAAIAVTNRIAIGKAHS